MLSHKGDRLRRICYIHTMLMSQVIKGMCLSFIWYFAPGWESLTEFVEHILPHPWKIDQNISLLRSRLSGCHATLPRKKRLLTFEPHSFPDLSQSQLQFHFLELSRAKFSKDDSTNNSSRFIVP